MLIFVGYPIASNLVLSFQDVTVKNLVNGEKLFVGLQNYIELLQDSVFKRAFINTLVFTVACLVFQFLIGLRWQCFLTKNSKLQNR